MNVLSKRGWLGCGRARDHHRRGRAMGGQALAGSKDPPASAQGARAAQRPAAARPPDRGERDPGRPEQGVGPPAALQGHGPNGQTVWYVLLDASDQGIAHDLGVNYAPKLGNLGIGCPECVQTVTLDSPTPDQNRFGQAVVNFQGAPDFSPTRIAEPGPEWLPARELPAGRRRRARATARSSASPARRPSTARRSSRPATARSTSSTTRTPATACSASTSPAPSAPGQFAESWVDLLFVKGFDAGQPIVYISTDAGQPLTAVLERSTYVPALDKAAYNGGDDFLGSARERLFGFINGQTGADNKESQGFVHLVKDGHASEDASAGNTALIDALRNGGDLLNVFGDFPTREGPAARPGLQPALGRPARPLDARRPSSRG